MISVKIVREGTFIRTVTVEGHSGYAHSGRDIVCAGVSAIVQTALLGLLKVSESDVKYKIDEVKGLLSFTVPSAKDEEERIKQEAITETMVLGVKDLADAYEAFIKVED